jgi:Asp-tRNA(Asn)/Glu-tRNA(Gln) amidotransferase A subunit family amidase
MAENKEAVWRWSATAIADAVRARRLSAVEVTRAVIARLEASDQSVDDAVLAGRDPGPLAGVPFSVKDLVVTQGVETAYGSHVLAGNIPDHDAEAVARLRRAGAVLIGKTNTPEFGHKALTSSPRYGYTRNPWNLERSPGGSSGGAAAAVAMGMGPLAVTTDGPGSSRIPASASGVLGLKPTLGRVPNETAVEQFSNFINIGLATRTVADLAAGLTAMSGACAGGARGAVPTGAGAVRRVRPDRHADRIGTTAFLRPRPGRPDAGQRHRSRADPRQLVRLYRQLQPHRAPRHQHPDGLHQRRPAGWFPRGWPLVRRTALDQSRCGVRGRGAVGRALAAGA